MAPASIDVLRRLWELATVRRDLDTALDLVHEDAVFDWSNSRAPYRGVYRGRDEMRTMWSNWLDAWDEWITDIAESVEVDPETVVIVTRVRARGKGSGVQVEARGASVWTFRDGKVSSAKLFQSKSEALASVA